MLAVSVSIDLFGSVAHKKRRAVLDWIVHYWSKIALTTAGCVPTLYGIENLPPAGEAVIYVPNHTSFMDILTLSGSVPRPFKYLSKEEIVKIPLIGWAMFLAQHVFLKRDNLQSTLQVSETVTQRLKDGNSMVLFAEGTRSKDGVVKTFKKGAFQMAQTAGVCELFMFMFSDMAKSMFCCYHVPCGMFHVEWCIRKPWSFFILLYDNKCLNHHTHNNP